MQGSTTDARKEHGFNGFHGLGTEQAGSWARTGRGDPNPSLAAARRSLPEAGRGKSIQQIF